MVFRADGHRQMGLGHLYRSSALAEMLLPEFTTVLAFRNCPEGLLTTFQNRFSGGFLNLAESTVADEPTFLLEQCQRQFPGFGLPPVIVLDGYHFRTEYQRTLKTGGVKLVCVDDIMAYRFVADVIVNHAGGITPADYDAPEETRFCLGLSYALLQSVFRTVPDREDGQQGEEGFICLGGADPPNATLRVLKRFLEVRPDTLVNVVVGAAYAHGDSLADFVKAADAKVVVHRNLAAEEMAALMANSSCGVTSPSTISYEYLSAGGTLYLERIADNQDRILDYFLGSGLAFSFAKDFGLVSPESEAESKAKRAGVFDGGIQRRYLRLFQDLVKYDTE